MVIVSHRLSSLVDCDQTLVLDRGEVVDIGPHRELLDRCAIYRHLWQQQNRHIDSTWKSPCRACSNSRAKQLTANRARRSPLPLAALEFESPSAAIIASPVPALSRAINLLVFLLVVSVLVASALIRVDKIVSAKGKLVADAPNVVLQPFDQSIVESIDVRKGDIVRKGQVLARLNPTFTAADDTAMKDQVDLLGAKAARLQAEAAGARLPASKYPTRMPPFRPRSTAGGPASMRRRCKPTTRGSMNCKPRSPAMKHKPPIFVSGSASLLISRICARSFWH